MPTPEELKEQVSKDMETIFEKLKPSIDECLLQGRFSLTQAGRILYVLPMEEEIMNYSNINIPKYYFYLVIVQIAKYIKKCYESEGWKVSYEIEGNTTKSITFSPSSKMSFEISPPKSIETKKEINRSELIDLGE